MRRSIGACFIGFSLLPAAARAESASPLRAAQKAYAAVDYVTTQKLARAGIEHGGNERLATAELYLLWATAAAALDQPDVARAAFTGALAANPELKLERSLSPKIRGPYLEARGALTTADGGEPLEIASSVEGHSLELRARDVTQVAVTIELDHCVAGGERFEEHRWPIQQHVHWAIPQTSELRYFARLLDKYGNVLAEQGTLAEPRRATFEAEKPTIPLAPQSSRSDRAAYFWTAGGLGLLGLASGGIAAGMMVRRENAAKEWNSTSCEEPGYTRMEQCSGVDERRRHAERLAIGFGIGGAALLLGSVVTLAVAPGSTERVEVSLQTGPERALLGLRSRF